MDGSIDRGGRRLTAWNHVRAVLLLPAMNTIFIPTVLLMLFRDARVGPGVTSGDWVAMALSPLLLASGLMLVIRTISLFVARGRGTLAPWDPTEVLITDDVYQFSRNPMKAGLFLVLIGECLLLRSVALTVWACCFITANVIYIRSFEEKGLEKRFGDVYRAYCRRVPRWLGNLSPRWLRHNHIEKMS